MKVAIHTLGTRGDVQPYLTLALALKAKGHQVLMAAPSQFEAFVETRGIPFAHLPDEFLALMETQEAKAAMTGSGGFAGGFKMMKLFKPIGRPSWRSSMLRLGVDLTEQWLDQEAAISALCVQEDQGEFGAPWR